MSALAPYQYVVLRFVPRVEREEFVNVGVVLHSQNADFLDAAFDIDEQRLTGFAGEVDLDLIRGSLEIVCQVCAGIEGGGRPRFDSLGQRFGWLAAPRSTVIQPGPRHSGLTANPADTLSKLLQSLVIRSAEHPRQ